MSPDNEVIERSAREPEAFSALFERHATSVYRYAAQRMGDRVAEDVMSETFLVGIATRLMRKHARLEATAWRGLSTDLAARIAPDLIEQAGARVDAERLTRRLTKALRKLGAADRDTLLLYAWADLDYASIADAIPRARSRTRVAAMSCSLPAAATGEALQNPN
ncbi:RNA polymerase sigma factor [Microbacterium imperiale]|uniref:RNA polymerase sigma-70 region 2 domain-containing protein n=1 Tax=Microbacterium imperiale TaxID=33884 RepID=A0A9W6M2S3_9MICO|nr:sigma-70 family RNA polymerase sigma factor [Microbacterium imperiale]MBP2419392.1 RNA polymerase sigma-70 factor (ECF subfamily) [Microbacterium imperiale]MDS0198738.1 sigma-70 family RNA polymerase sigma factor [Microbacterium imperiale]BFE39734.1 hypothetical protein GCM10017544_06900 [Microbacterium imperiale]GLJ79290.1 hypothetical protein GCM10017586_09720 [Microbacterium imperiale]